MAAAATGRRRQRNEEMTSDGAARRINARLESLKLGSLDDRTAEQFAVYLSLFLRWNERLNLTSVRTESGIITRHLAESIACARAIPEGVATLLDFGSGAGLPGIPIALCRPEIAVTLAESQSKKASFLHEVARQLAIPVKVHASRAEDLSETFDCVVLRAVDKMPKAVASATKMVGGRGWIGLMTTSEDLVHLQAATGTEFSWSPPVTLPEASERIVAFGQKLP
jgi:16S rRNA (guanine527-N7)-methyltransferase